MEEKQSAAPLINRELSWLSFNGRVLQEAADPSVPLFERFAFLSIFSSNLDEFFRVRVASLRALLRLKKRTTRELGIRPARLLREIHATVVSQQEEFGRLFREVLIPELEAEGVVLIQDPHIYPEIHSTLRKHFIEEVRPVLEVRDLPNGTDSESPFLEDRTVYLVVELWPDPAAELAGFRPDYSLIRIPSPPLPRFVEVALEDGRHGIVFVDDVIRLHLGEIFPDREVGGAYSVKLSRDADLYLDDEYGVALVEAIRRSLSKRSTGVPSRFLYDKQAPYALVERIKSRLGLENEDLVLGGRYHNLHDLRDLPDFGLDHLHFAPWPDVPHTALESSTSILDAVSEQDHLLHFPYQSFDHVVRFIREAAEDPLVEELHLTVYRVSPQSKILTAMLDAARAGKMVHVFFEVQARFDEASNLGWAQRLEEAGARVNYSIPGLKVHAKVAMVVRRNGNQRQRLVYLGTGNFNEVTSRFYTDLGLLTADEEIADDVERLFAHIGGLLPDPDFDCLMVAPRDLRRGLIEKIQGEISEARAGRPAAIDLKLNALEDSEMAEALTLASQAGVAIRGVIRGICCLAPQVEGLTESIEFRSIVDRYLEHTRIYSFHAAGKREVWLGSADLMTRNLSRRIEVVFPIKDARLAREVLQALEIQFLDDAKARVIDRQGRNRYAVGLDAGQKRGRAQANYRQWLQSVHSEPTSE